MTPAQKLVLDACTVIGVAVCLCAGVAAATLIIGWLLNKIISFAFHTVGWFSAVVRFMRLSHMEKIRLKEESEREQSEASSPHESTPQDPA
jgi:hypothetical protein